MVNLEPNSTSVGLSDLSQQFDDILGNTDRENRNGRSDRVHPEQTRLPNIDGAEGHNNNERDIINLARVTQSISFDERTESNGDNLIGNLNQDHESIRNSTNSISNLEDPAETLRHQQNIHSSSRANSGNTYSVIYSTFRNIDALVEGKNLGVNNSEHQHGAVESQNENNPSPFHPFSHHQQQHNETLNSPSRDHHHQLPPPLNPIETTVTSTVEDDHSIRNIVESSSLISPTPNRNVADGSILNLQLQETEHRVQRPDNADQVNDLNKAGRVPWNLSHLVGSFQSPSSTSAGATSSEYAANQAVSAGGGASAGSSGALPHPLPHYSAHHYSSSPQTSAASYHQPDLAAWGGPGGGSVGGANLGMHSQSSPLTSLTSVAMAAASAVSADSPSGSNTGGGGYAPTKMDPESLASMYYPHQATSSPAGNVDPASESAPAAASSSATASSTTTSSLSATTAAMASARAETAASVDPLTFQSIPPTLESQEVISTLHQYFNQSEMPQLVEGAWIDPALSSVPYHPDYGDGRGGYKDRKKEIIKNWTKSNTTPPTSSAANGSSGASSSIVDPIAAAHASLSSRSSNIPSGAVPSPYNEYYTPYGATGTKEDAASAQLRDYYAQQAQAHAVQATYAAYAAQDPALYPYAAAGLSVHPGNHHHHLAGATASHSGHPHHGHHSHTSASHLGLNPGGSIGASATPGGGMIGGIGGVGGMHGGNSGSRRERKRLKHQALAAEQANLANAGIGGIGSPGSSLSRDERKAHNLRLPITVMDIINLPMDEFNDLLSKHELTEEQLTLCRDIRRRGKNKVAARNCRKRKIDQIKQLEDDVGRIRNQKGDLIREHERLMAQRTHWTDMVKRLHDHVLKELGHDPNLWQLQMDHNRQVHILPRSQSQETDPTKAPRPYHYAPSLGPPMMEGGGLPSQR